MNTDFEAAIERFLDETWTEEPLLATSVGIDGYERALPDLSAGAFARRDAWRDRWAATFGAFADDALDPAQRIDRDLIGSTLRGEQIRRPWLAWRRTPEAYLTPGLYGVFTLFLHRTLPEPDLAEAAIARLEGIPALLEHGKANIDPSLTPRLFAERAVGTCKAGIAYARTLVPREVSDPALRERVAAAGETAARAFEDYGAFLASLTEHASGEWMLGEEMYSALLREKEMVGFDARSLRERGRELVAGLDEEMSRLAKEATGDPDWRTWNARLKQDHPATPEAMRDAYEEWTERARAYLREHALVTFPDGERCLVEPSPPFQRPVLAVASYSRPPAFKAGRTGHFFVPFPPDGTPDGEVQQRLATNSFHVIPAVSVHEAYPGHHWHLVWAQGNPRPIRKIMGSSFFSEGWALYTEKMMREHGFFTDPAHQLGQLEARIFRAARIVVDTSLHIGEMTPEEAVAYMTANSGLTEPTAKAEVSRYCAWPTQATSYLTGSIEVERMRERWFGEGKGTLREFHDAICAEGALPPALAERALFG